MNMLSPINWFGGKFYLRRRIVDMFPVNYEDYHYLELFAGAAHVLFYKKESVVETINDINWNLVNFYKVVQNKYKDFIKSFEWALKSRCLFKRYYNDINDEKKKRLLSDVELAYRFFYVLKMSFSGTGKRIAVNTIKNHNLNVDRIKNDINYTHNRLKNVNIYNCDYNELLKMYGNHDDMLFYLDPPYHTPGAKEYTRSFSDNDFVDLCDRLRCIKSKFVLSLNKDKFVSKLFGPYFNVEEVEVPYFVNNDKGMFMEYVITNYSLDNTPYMLEKKNNLRKKVKQDEKIISMNGFFDE